MSLNLTTAAFCDYIMLGELEAVKVNHALFSATILLQGAQLIEFTPKEDSNWLWLSAQATYQKGQSVRGGIPICWPWFGAAKRNPPTVQEAIKQPNNALDHGIARTLQWQLSALDERVCQVSLNFSLNRQQTMLPNWCGHVEPKLVIVLTKNQLQINLINTNNGKHDASICQALHTYLPTDDIRNSHIQGLENHFYVDALNQWLCFKQQGAVRFNSETDRIYRTSLPAMHLITPTYRIHIESLGSNSAVIWNPWIDKAQRLSQFAAEDYTKMLCIETANVLDDHLKLAPQQTHSLSLRLTKDHN